MKSSSEKNQFPKPTPKPAAEVIVKDAEEIAPEHVQTNQVSVFNPTSQSETIRNSLMTMLEKVSNDKNAIPQAKAMVDIANSIINVQKNELHAFQIMQKLKPNGDAGTQ